MPAGSSMRTATFKAMSGDYKISDIIVSGNIVGGGNDTAVKINSDGSWGQIYYYLTEAGTGWVPDGWYKDDFGGEAVTEEDVLKIGEAFMVSSVSDFSLTFAGQVAKGTVDVIVPAGSSIIGNPTPVNVKISTIIVEGAVAGGNDTAVKINADGSWGQIYYYLTVAGTGWVPDGWYKDDYGGEAVSDSDTLEPGESMIFSAINEYTIKFPASL